MPKVSRERDQPPMSTAVKPSAQPTQVRTLHLPPPAKQPVTGAFSGFAGCLLLRAGVPLGLQRKSQVRDRQLVVRTRQRDAKGDPCLLPTATRMTGDIAIEGLGKSLPSPPPVMTTIGRPGPAGAGRPAPRSRSGRKW